MDNLTAVVIGPSDLAPDQDRFRDDMDLLVEFLERTDLLEEVIYVPDLGAMGPKVRELASPEHRDSLVWVIRDSPNKAPLTLHNNGYHVLLLVGDHMNPAMSSVPSCRHPWKHEEILYKFQEMSNMAHLLEEDHLWAIMDKVEGTGHQEPMQDWLETPAADPQPLPYPDNAGVYQQVPAYHQAPVEPERPGYGEPDPFDMPADAFVPTAGTAGPTAPSYGQPDPFATHEPGPAPQPQYQPQAPAPAPQPQYQPQAPAPQPRPQAPAPQRSAQPYLPPVQPRPPVRSGYPAAQPEPDPYAQPPRGFPPPSGDPREAFGGPQEPERYSEPQWPDEAREPAVLREAPVTLGQEIGAAPVPPLNLEDFAEAPSPPPNVDPALSDENVPEWLRRAAVPSAASAAPQIRVRARPAVEPPSRLRPEPPGRVPTYNPPVAEVAPTRGEERLVRSLALDSPDAPVVRHGRVIATVVPKGGTGKSSCTAALALRAAQRLHPVGKKVILLEANVLQASLCRYMGVKGKTPTLSSIASEPLITGPVVRRAIVQINNYHLDVLFGSTKANETNPEVMSPRFYRNVVDQLIRAYDYIFIDTQVAEPWSPMFRDFVLPQADQLLVIVDHSQIAIDHTIEYLQTIASPMSSGVGHNVLSSSVGIVLNEYRKESALSMSDIKAQFQAWTWWGHVPFMPAWKDTNNEYKLLLNNEVFSYLDPILSRATTEMVFDKSGELSHAAEDRPPKRGGIMGLWDLVMEPDEAAKKKKKK